MKIASKQLLYTPDWMVSFEREMAGDIILSHNAGEPIRKYRRRYGLSQDELGSLMNLRRESISRIENGSVTPTFDFVKYFIKTMALVEAIRVERAQKKEMDVYFLENVTRESGISRDKMPFIIKLAVDSYDKKLMKIQKSLKENKYGK
ncbi:MAG: helix-turn-helix transcriptional regulator [Candidatus Methanoperedens sp.]|nr:helix-turn-helix transcriptional regulator [Candidatus Methanoperedens sp.]